MKKNNLFNAVINISVITLLAQMFFECNRNSDNKSNPQKKTIPQTPFLLKPPSSFTDTLVIKLPSAVFYNPDSLQLEKN